MYVIFSHCASVCKLLYVYPEIVYFVFSLDLGCIFSVVLISFLEFQKVLYIFQCLSPEDVYQLSGLAQQTTDKEVSLVSMMLVHLLENRSCSKEDDNTFVAHHKKPSSLEGKERDLLIFLHFQMFL